MLEASSFSNLTERLSGRLDSRPNSRHAKKILSLIEKMEIQAAALDKTRKARNPVETEAAHSRKVAGVARKLQAEATRVREEVSDIYVAGVAELGNAIDFNSELVQTEHSAEIRAAFRNMTGKQRSDTLNAALQEGNSEIIASVGMVPSILSGVTADVQQRYMDVIRQQKAPDLIAQKEDLAEAYDAADAADKLAGIIFAENYDPGKQSAIDKAERDSAEAATELAATMVD
jgi:hypothetical protein